MKKMIIPFILILAGIFLACYGMWVWAELKEVTPAFLVYTFAIFAAVLGAGVKFYQDKRSGEKQNEIRDSAKRAAELSQQGVEAANDLKNRETGGNSFCYIHFIELPESKTVKMFLKHSGKYALPALEIYITDATFFLNKNDPAFGYADQETINRTVTYKQAIVPIGKQTELGTFPLPPLNERQLYVITFETANGERKWFQRVQFIPEKDFWPSDQYPYPKELLMPHRIAYQVYTTRTDDRPNMTETDGGKSGPSKVTYVQYILKEQNIPGANTKPQIKWNKLHLGYNERSFFHETEYAPESGESPEH